MKTSRELQKKLHQIDHKSYPAYKDCKGSYSFKTYIFSLRHVQSDPYASPSRASIECENLFPSALYDGKARKRALEDFLLRKFKESVGQYCSSGSKKSGFVSVFHPGQCVLERTGCTVREDSIVLRFSISLPANGRKINTAPLIRILFEQLPKAVHAALDYNAYSLQEKEEVQQASDLAFDQQFIRNYLRENKLAAFVGNQSVLPRISGSDDRPMSKAVPFLSPKENEISIELPSGKTISGMAIPQGITLIAGGGYHGKSTLLQALQNGVYDHIQGDGREYVITDESAVKIRAEDGRSIQGNDITAFIQNLPQKKDTLHFSTQDASGSTSQAANVMEAIEAGSKVLIMDEDTSATNFLIRDALMQQVIHPDQEPIIPFLERIEDLKEKGISTILVAGSSGAFFEPADVILQMDQYEPKNITETAKEQMKAYQKKYPELFSKTDRSAADFHMERHPEKLKVLNGEKKKIKARGMETICLNREDIDVRYLEQLQENAQLAAIGKLLQYLSEHVLNGKITVSDAVDMLEKKLDEEGIQLAGEKDFSRPRKQEIAAALSRLRSLKLSKEGKESA